MTTKLSHEPIYNIKSVSEQTGIQPVTLRAWERRYGFPSPQRTDSGYRLFSEYDIAALNWLKQQTESGMSIGQAVKLLGNLIERGEDPLVKGMLRREVFETGFQSIEQAQPALVKALLALDEKKAQDVMQMAFNLFTMEQVLVEIIQPTLVEIGDRWHAGEISVATEHFASHQCRLFLFSAYEETAEEELKGSVVAACAPGEQHELGLLMVTVLLRSRGWHVTYLGANTPLERYAETVRKINPQILLFSAASLETAEQLTRLAEVLDELPEPKPIIGLGGQAFADHPALANHIPGTILGPTGLEAVHQIERMLERIN